MSGRELEAESQSVGDDSLAFRYGRNWTAVAFFGVLGGLHLAIALAALISYHWESHLSAVFGTLFVAIAICCALVRHEVVVRKDRRRVSVRTGLGRIAVEHVLPFSAVACVRVTLMGRNTHESRVAIVCEDDEIELPPCPTPRQQGLLLAMTLNTRLVKVYGEGPPPEPAQRIANLYRNEDAV